MDALLARYSVLTPYVVSCVCLGMAEGASGPAHDLLGAASIVALLFALRLTALTNGRPAERWPVPVVLTLRVALAAVAGAWVWLANVPGWDRTLMTAAVVAGVAYVIRPYPDWLALRA